MARKRKNVRANSVDVQLTDLKPGMIFEKDNCIYTKQMIVSEKIMKTLVGTYRECVAWNSEMCRRFDTTEKELSNSKFIGQLRNDELEQYVCDCQKTHWNDIRLPVKEAG